MSSSRSSIVSSKIPWDLSIESLIMSDDGLTPSQQEILSLFEGADYEPLPNKEALKIIEAHAANSSEMILLRRLISEV